MTIPAEAIGKLFAAYIVLMVVGYGYNKYKQKNLIKEEYDDSKLIKKYLLNDSTLAHSRNPILWIHVEFDKNSRNWESFGSRTSTDLNQPYQYLTIRSIVKHCGESFNVCIIDDETFHKILPDWNTNVGDLAAPLRGHLRDLAMAKVLHAYGGLCVPSTFVCQRDLRALHDSYLSTASVMMGELPVRTSVTSQLQHFPSTKFMACKKGCPVMREYTQYLEALYSKEYTNESDFSGESGRWFYKKYSEFGRGGSSSPSPSPSPSTDRRPVALVSAELLGAKTVENKPVLLEDLLGYSVIPFACDRVGVYIPGNEVLRRTKYQWFARMSTQQVLHSNTVLARELDLAQNV